MPGEKLLTDLGCDDSLDKKKMMHKVPKQFPDILTSVLLNSMYDLTLIGLLFSSFLKLLSYS